MDVVAEVGEWAERSLAAMRVPGANSPKDAA